MIWRTILGVLLGDVIFAGGSALLFYAARVDPQAPAEVRFILISVGGGIVLAMSGGWVAGWFGRRNDLVCGILLAALIAARAVGSLISRPGRGAGWSQTAALVLMAPAALAGDWVSARRRRIKNR